MKTRLFVFLSILLVLSFALAGCGAKPASEANTNESAEGSSAKEDIWLAFIYPMTGDNAMFGEIEMRAHKYVIDRINAQGGIDGRQIKYEVFDDRGDPKEAASIAQKVVGDPKFVAGMGHFRSVCTLAAAPIYDEAKFPFLTDSVNQKISGLSPWLFRYSITDSEAAKQLVWAATKNHPEWKKAAILYTQSDFGVGLKDAMIPELEKLGVEVVGVESYFEGQSKDYTPQLTKIKEANPDLVFMLGYYAEAAAVVQQATQLGMKDLTFWGPDGLVNQGLIDLAGKEAERVYATAYFSPTMTYPDTAATVKDFKTATGEDLDGFGAITLDANQMLLEGIKAVGTDREKLREWLSTHKGFVGSAGPIEYDASNDNMRRIVVVVPKDGSFVLADEQVPEEYFTQK